MGVELLSRAPSARLLRAVLLAAAALSAQSTRCLSAAPRVVRRFETGEQGAGDGRKSPRPPHSQALTPGVLRRLLCLAGAANYH
jgi:hypothetical protein